MPGVVLCGGGGSWRSSKVVGRLAKVGWRGRGGGVGVFTGMVGTGVEGECRERLCGHSCFCGLEVYDFLAGGGDPKRKGW